MNNSETKWSVNDKIIPPIQPHTKRKHLLIEQYVTDYIYTLYGKGVHGVDRFTFIDGFCGGGIYHDPESSDKWYGSPIRLINAVRKGYLKSKRTYSLDVKFIFIDSTKNHLDYLKNFVFTETGFEELLDEEKHIIEKFEKGNLTVQCEFMCDQFENKVDYCYWVAENRKGNSLFFLDPFGWSDVSMNSFRKINSLKKSEVIYTFMIDYIHRFIEGQNWTARETFSKILETDGYFDINELKNLDKYGEQAFYQNELMRLFRDRGNAKKIITFAMMSKYQERVEYYLVHICHHLRALEVMKDGSWKFNNLDYQYNYEIFGHGFKTASYYQENQLDLQLDIKEDTEISVINRLSKDIDYLLNKFPDGISFKDLCSKTMELNPAKRNHYCKYLKILQDAKEIKIYRKDKVIKITENKGLQNIDIIKMSHEKTLFPLRPFIIK